MKERIITTTETVPLDSLEPHPRNPRRGDIQLIAESLATHGQYRPIVANRRDNRILAGSHTWRAARELGWKHISVSWVDASETEAKRILLADNRTSDLATYDESLLIALIRSCEDPTSGGYSRDDLDALEGLYDAPLTMPAAALADEPEDLWDYDIVIGPLRMNVERRSFERWAIPIEQNPLRPIENIRRKLRLPAKPKIGKVDPESTPIKLSTVTETIIPIESINPFPGNARQGDIGTLMDSLATNGQFRPIVVNQRDNTILVGNHTWHAAKQLGWDRIAVTFVDVTDDEAKQIVLIDNRSSDLSGYDTETLISLLTELSTDLSGTGFDGDDLDDLLAGAQGKPSQALKSGERVAVGKWKLRLPKILFDPWFQELGPEPASEIAIRLDLPSDCWRLDERFTGGRL